MKIFSHSQDTIVAPASPVGSSPRAIVRVSGEDAFSCVMKIVKIDDEIKSGKAIVCGVLNINDNGLFLTLPVSVFFLKSPKTYTMEDVAEIHFVGSNVIREKIISALCENGARLATAGEFTLRAFLNGRIDLVQAESVERIISANSEAERKVALSQVEGLFSDRIKRWRKMLLEVASQIEGELDFEQDEVSEMSTPKIVKKLEGAITDIEKIFNSRNIGSLRHGHISVVLSGKTNAGKSSVINALLGKDGAVVSHEATTTRDIVNYEMDVEPFSFILQDSPGYDFRAEKMATLASERASVAGEMAGIILLVIDGSLPYTDVYKNIIKKLPPVPIVVVANKIDLGLLLNIDKVVEDIDKHFVELNVVQPRVLAIKVSAEELTGISELKQMIVDIAVADIEQCEGQGNFNRRTQEELANVMECLSNARSLLLAGELIELVAEEIRDAYNSLGHIAGVGYAEEVLESIFSRFCIGK